jgi:predicted alpha/beta-fold hydrolase
MWKSTIDFEQLEKAKTLRDFDEAFTIKVHGYKDVEDYYQDASSLPYVKDIQIPVLAINAYDDPFVNPDVLDHQNPKMILAVTNHGGHLGFLEGPFFPCRTNWTVKVVEQYIDHFL